MVPTTCAQDDAFGLLEVNDRFAFLSGAGLAGPHALFETCLCGDIGPTGRSDSFAKRSSSNTQCTKHQPHSFNPTPDTSSNTESTLRLTHAPPTLCLCSSLRTLCSSPWMPAALCSCRCLQTERDALRCARPRGRAAVLAAVRAALLTSRTSGDSRTPE